MTSKKVKLDVEFVEPIVIEYLRVKTLILHWFLYAHLLLSRAPHRNRKHTAIRVFYTGTRTVPCRLAIHYLTAITNTDVYRIDLPNLLL